MEPSQSKRSSARSSLKSPAELNRPLVSNVGIDCSPSGAEDKLPTGPASVPPPDHAQFAEEVHNYVRECIRNADQKAKFFLAATTAMLAFLYTQNVAARWLKDVRQWTMPDLFGFVSMFGLGVAVTVLLAVVFPSRKGSRRGIIFFNAIAEYDNSTEYADEVIRRSGEQAVRAKLQHVYDLSKICARTYKILCVGFWIGSVGIGAALLYLLSARITP